MKKVLMMVLLCILIFIPTIVSAQVEVFESNDIDIIINGQIKQYDTVPLIVKGRTLLPLRAILNDLGIDDEHIMWNNDDKSVTFSDDASSTTVFMKIGSSTAVVNELEMLLDASPILYNSRTYVPARFISESIGKNVLWNNFSRSVIICDKEHASRNAELLKKTDEAMNELQKFDFAMSICMQIEDENLKMDILTDMTYKIDNINKIIFSTSRFDMPFVGKVAQENYILNRTMFQKTTGVDQWDTMAMTKEEFDSNFEGIGDVLGGIYVDELAHNSLSYTEDKETGMVVLKGRVDAEEMFEVLEKTDVAGRVTGTNNLKYESVFVEISINPVNRLIEKMAVDFTGQILQMDNYADFKALTTFDFNYNDFEIVVPADILLKLQNQ